MERMCLAGVNSYLVRSGDRFVLIDTSKPEKRAELDSRIAAAGCREGDLGLILLTHGDYDHAGNAAYLRQKHGAKIAMHESDAGRVERGDWSLGMKPKPDKFPLLFQIVSAFIRPGPFETFSPYVFLRDGQRLSALGLAGVALHLPGHTQGSIGVLTPQGNLFCGDLLDNLRGKPGLQFFIDDMEAASLSLARLRTLGVKRVYPGHGNPFDLKQLK
jgi:glyoxylase-like metal-dependent hydrolase (beta-lactamase superfamily II)